MVPIVYLLETDHAVYMCDPQITSAAPLGPSKDINMPCDIHSKIGEFLNSRHKK